MEQNLKPIMDELRIIREDLDYIKECIVDQDTVLTDDDERALKKAEEDYKKGKTKRLI